MIKNEANPHLIFLCAGNICRSPYAELKFKQMLTNSNISNKNNFIVQSGGFIKQKDRNIHQFTEKALLDENFSKDIIDQHEPRTMRKHKEDLINATVLIVMAKQHKDILLPSKYRNKAILLSELALGNAGIDIPDPALIEDYDEYRNILNEISMYLKMLIGKLEN